jgi:hypothetical protein
MKLPTCSGKIKEMIKIRTKEITTTAQTIPSQSGNLKLKIALIF